MRLIIYIFMLFLLIGCNQAETESQEPISPDQVRYDKEIERDDSNNHPLRQYTESEEKGISEYGTKREIFRTDEALRVTQLLSERDDVRHAHVATSDTQVVAFVLLKDYEDHHIAKTLEEEVKTIVPDKDIYIYTDKNHYNRIEDLKSSMKPRQIGKDLQRFFEKYLNLDIKD